MPELSSIQKNRLNRLEKITKAGNIAIIDEINKLNEKLDGEVDVIKDYALEAIKIAQETQKQEGQKGLDGRDGKDGINGKDGVDGKDGEDGKNGRDGRDGRDGKDGKDGQDGLNGIDGKDGSPDTGKQIVDKINDLDTDDDDLKIDAKHIKNLSKVDNKQSEEIATLQNRTQLLNQITSGIERRITTLENRPQGSSGTWYEEVLTRIDGTNYTLSNSPLSIVFLFLNGQRQTYGVDYTRSGTAITMLSATIEGDILTATYS